MGSPPCWEEEFGRKAEIDFRAVWTNGATYTEARFWTRTNEECLNGATVQNDVMLMDTYLTISSDHWAYELNGFNLILETHPIHQVFFWSNGTITPAQYYRYPEHCSVSGDDGELECDLLCRRPSAGKNSDDETSNSLEDCCWYSPIVIDILGNGFDLTNAENGVIFDFNGDGVSHRISWTSFGSDDAWLVLDRNDNGLIDSSREMFGNFTDQPVSNERNGFLALAQFDKAEKGGNSDNKINRQDEIFDSLRLWQDTNHDGISEASELSKLLNLDVKAIELDYRESRRTDEHGNRFKYKAKVRDRREAEVGRWAFDVFLVLDQTQN